MTNMCTCVILLLLRLAANMLMNIILIMAEKRLNLTNLRIEMYPTEGPMLKAPVAPVPLMVSCSKSQTTVGVGRYTHTTPDLDITAGPITAEFVRTGSDVPSLPVMNLKMRK